MVRVVFVRERVGIGWVCRGLLLTRPVWRSPIVEDLINMGLPIKAVSVTRKVKVDLFRWLTVCFEQRKVVIPDHEKLLLQLKSIRRRYVKVAENGSRRARLEITQLPKVHDDIVYALALALALYN